MEQPIVNPWQQRSTGSTLPVLTYAKQQDSLLRFPPTPPDFLDASDKVAEKRTLQLALHVIETERDALTNLYDLYNSDSAVQTSLRQAVNCIAKASLRDGRVVVSGVGKSGKIGQKFVATLNSFNIRSSFLHPVEAMHGDLGMIGPNDVLVILSYSGKTQEILSMMPYIPSDLPMVAVTAYRDVSACPLFAHRSYSNCILLPAPIPCSELEAFGTPAPTSSTTTALALTDALALALAQRLHASPLAVFHSYHPGGAIGASTIQIRSQLMGDIAVQVNEIPIIPPRMTNVEVTVLDALLTAAGSASGWVRLFPDRIITPRKIQRVGRQSDLNQLLSSLDDGIVIEKGDWISIDAANSVQEARDWILQMRKSERGRTFLKEGTILGIVDAQQLVSGVVEIEEIMSDGELEM